MKEPDNVGQKLIVPVWEMKNRHEEVMEKVITEYPRIFNELLGTFLLLNFKHHANGCGSCCFIAYGPAKNILGLEELAWATSYICNGCQAEFRDPWLAAGIDVTDVYSYLKTQLLSLGVRKWLIRQSDADYMAKYATSDVVYRLVKTAISANEDPNILLDIAIPKWNI